jgi:replication factor C subunit 3/5
MDSVSNSNSDSDNDSNSDKKSNKEIKNKKIITTKDVLNMYDETIEWIKQFENNDNNNEFLNKKQENNIIPLTEKCRPNNLNDIVSHKNIIEILKEYIAKKQLPHLLLYGPPGTGKTSTIVACAKELYKTNYSLMVLEINASEERGIEVIRHKIKDFITTKGVYLTKKSVMFKLVILDEADAMTSDAQSMLRSVIEKYTENVRFCLICNYVKKINPAIKSRCTILKFPPLLSIDIKNRIKTLNTKLKYNITDDGIEKIIKISKGDMRKILNILYSVNMIYDKVDQHNVAKCLDYPSDENMTKIYEILTTNNFNNSITKFKKIINENSYAITDILTEITDIITKKFINKEINTNIFCSLISNLKDIEYNVTVCPSEDIQFIGIVASFNIAYTN